jgi:hypothetical protein
MEAPDVRTSLTESWMQCVDGRLEKRRACLLTRPVACVIRTGLSIEIFEKKQGEE